MKVFARSMWLSLLLVAAPQIVPAAERMLTGELVVLENSPGQFRLVDHGGAFRAPAGVDLESWDGKPVQVELGSNGQVLSIREMQIDVAPIVHGYEVVSGILVAADPAGSTFSIAGDGRTYQAPAGVDLRAFNNRMVEVRLDEKTNVTEIVPLRQAADAPVAPAMAPATLRCLYRGQSYSEGAPLCQGNTRFRCEHGQWQSIGQPCSVDEAR